MYARVLIRPRSWMGQLQAVFPSAARLLLPSMRSSRLRYHQVRLRRLFGSTHRSLRAARRYLRAPCSHHRPRGCHLHPSALVVISRRRLSRRSGHLPPSRRLVWALEDPLRPEKAFLRVLLPQEGFKARLASKVEDTRAASGHALRAPLAAATRALGAVRVARLRR